MNNVLLALIVGLGAGLAGGYFSGMARSPAEDGGGLTVARVDLSSIETRLDRIEAQLDVRLEEAAPSLRGTGDADAAPQSLAGSEAAIEALLDRMDTRMREAVAESVRTTWEELGEPTTTGEIIEVPAKKVVTLAEAARELELSGAEEDDVRRIHEETMDKVIALVAKDDEGGEAKVRQDFEEAKTDPQKRMALMGTYIGRMMGNLGGFIQLGMDHDAKMKAAIGPEKAQRFENEFAVTDLDPYSLDEMFSFGD